MKKIINYFKSLSKSFVGIIIGLTLLIFVLLFVLVVLKTGSLVLFKNAVDKETINFLFAIFISVAISESLNSYLYSRVELLNHLSMGKTRKEEVKYYANIKITALVLTIIISGYYILMYYIVSKARNGFFAFTSFKDFLLLISFYTAMTSVSYLIGFKRIKVFYFLLFLLIISIVFILLYFFKVSTYTIPIIIIIVSFLIDVVNIKNTLEKDLFSI